MDVYSIVWMAGPNETHAVVQGIYLDLLKQSISAKSEVKTK